MNHSDPVAVLRSVADCVWKSLPQEAQRTLAGCKIHAADLGRTDAGCEIFSLTSRDGRHVFIGGEILKRFAADEGQLERILAKELAFCLRLRRGVAGAPGSATEQAECAKVTKSWGFRNTAGSRSGRRRQQTRG
jgi:hypothetical protein